MSRNSIRRSLCVFALVLGVSAAPASAAPRGFLSDAGSLWTRLAGMFELARPFGKSGCSVDPNGQRVCVKTGCSVDPDGKPACEPILSTAKKGCSIDPNGKPVCEP